MTMRLRFGPLSRRARWMLVVGIAALVLFGPGLVELARLSIRQHSMDRQLARLAAEHDRLTQAQDRLQHDATYVEGLIRSTFKWAQKGETVVLLDEPSHSVR